MERWGETTCIGCVARIERCELVVGQGAEVCSWCKVRDELMCHTWRWVVWRNNRTQHLRDTDSRS
ncbi:hypothetical protein SESBI_04172 [Sesbania bispinosa]|nr:hypothetical protein SESBI_04172 [Sesbania bispinosa]